MVFRKSNGQNNASNSKSERVGWIGMTILSSALFVASATLHGTPVPESIANVVTDGSGILSVVSFVQLLAIKRGPKEPSEWKD